MADDPRADVHVTPGGSLENLGVTEEKIEYRDENGVLLDDEQVKALEGKVSFSTRYETRTRLVDEAGNEVYEGPAGGQGNGDDEPFAGTRADAPDPETDNGGEVERTKPASNKAGADVEKEKARVDDAKATAEPESEDGARETGRDEL